MLSCPKPITCKFLDCLKAEQQALTDVKNPKETGGNYLSHVHPNGSVMINNFREL